jgi:hypothetical protein
MAAMLYSIFIDFIASGGGYAIICRNQMIEYEVIAARN